MRRIQDEGRIVVMFCPDQWSNGAMAYPFTPKRHAVEHVLSCSTCGTADDRFKWSEPADASEVSWPDPNDPMRRRPWSCRTCGSKSGRTREVRRSRA
jgi:hypothetical protein